MSWLKPKKKVWFDWHFSIKWADRLLAYFFWPSISVNASSYILFHKWSVSLKVGRTKWRRGNRSTDRIRQVFPLKRHAGQQNSLHYIDVIIVAVVAAVVVPERVFHIFLNSLSAAMAHLLWLVSAFRRPVSCGGTSTAITYNNRRRLIGRTSTWRWHWVLLDFRPTCRELWHRRRLVFKWF